MSDDPDETQVLASQLRDTLSKVLRRAERGEATVIKRYKDTVAVVISPEDYEDLKRLRAAEAEEERT
ncbi:type II toxin-antitoxin system prevent-host-death family antitoxin [Nonomuraea roseoviolacea]|uniref:type II toxin-antitoxin system prevent-host-death family antitoxin n=1 Tax=Nonomuraea roseoviolacea TaxID=103837 RepID=UPI0031D17A26